MIAANDKPGKTGLSWPTSAGRPSRHLDDGAIPTVAAAGGHPIRAGHPIPLGDHDHKYNAAVAVGASSLDGSHPIRSGETPDRRRSRQGPVRWLP